MTNHGPENNEQRNTVLLVDDETMVLEVGEAILKRLGHCVLTAVSGEDALQQFSKHRQAIGCVVLDLTMPVMDGKQIFQRMRELSPDLPIIIASGLSADEVWAEFEDMDIRPTSIIQKPYQVAGLSSQIDEFFKN